jgi:hypothetical protein
VAIPLRENVPIYCVNLSYESLEFGWNFRLEPTALKPPTKDFKLLKFLILRVVFQLLRLYHKTAFFSPLEKRRIEGVTGLFQEEKWWVQRVAAIVQAGPKSSRGDARYKNQGRPVEAALKAI